MHELARQRASIVFAVLLFLTALSFWLTAGHGSALLREDKSLVWTTIIVLAFVKARFIMLDFMELRGASVKLRALFEFWGIAVATALIVVNCIVT